MDYVINNLAERFNNWIKGDKVKHLDDLMDTIRQKIMIKWNHRRKIARKMAAKILPHIVAKLREQSFNLDIDVIPFPRKEISKHHLQEEARKLRGHQTLQLTQ